LRIGLPSMEALRFFMESIEVILSIHVMAGLVPATHARRRSQVQPDRATSPTRVVMGSRDKPGNDVVRGVGDHGSCLRNSSRLPNGS
jgi:hypothetical protein